MTGRIIAQTSDRYLCYGVILNVTADKEANEQLKFLNQIAHDILVVSDSNNAINDILKKLLTYFNSERTYIMEDSADGKYISNTYETCADGILSVRCKRQKLASGMSGRRSHDAFVINDINTCKDCSAPFINMLQSQGVHSTVIVPLIYDGHIFGSFGIDNPKIIWNQVERFKVLGDYIAILLNKRDTMLQYNNAKNTITSLMDNTPGGFVRMKLINDTLFIPVYANDGFRNMLGMSHEKLMNIYGQNVLDGVHPDDREIIKSVGERMLKCGHAESAKFRVQNKNGEYIWLTLYGRISKEISGDTYLNVYYTDVTKDISDEEIQKRLLDNLPCGVALFEYKNKDLHVIHINKKYWQLVERQPNESLSVADTIHPDDLKIVESELASAISKKREAHVDIRILCGSGDYRLFHINAGIRPETSGIYTLFVSCQLTNTK